MNFNLSDYRSLRLTTLCVLYVSQGMPDGFVRTGLKTYLIANGASLAEVANLIALVSWPWAIKWIWGPVIDRFSHSSLGRRRPWILRAQFLMGMTLATMLLIPDLPANMRILGMTVLLINCFSSLQDVAVDALAIDLLPDRERGVINGFMFASAVRRLYGRVLEIGSGHTVFCVHGTFERVQRDKVDGGRKHKFEIGIDAILCDARLFPASDDSASGLHQWEFDIRCY